MTGRFLSAALMLIALGACSQSTDDVVVDDPRSSEPAADLVDDSPPAGLLFASDADAVAANEFTSRFWVPEQKYFVVRAPVTGDSSIQFLQMDLYQPDGTLYGRYSRAYSTDDNAPTRVDDPSADGSLPVLQVIDGDPSHVIITIPIAGTGIVQYQLFGLFHAELRLGLETSLPTVATGAFEILYAEPEGM